MDPMPSKRWLPAGLVPESLTGSAENTTRSKVTGTINLTIISTAASCSYGNGSIVVTASGGTAPYSYSCTYPGAFTTTQNFGNFQGLLGSTYIIQVTDATGQTVSTVVNLANNYPGPTLTISNYTEPTGCSSFDGSIITAVSGGTPPYQYSIDDQHWQSSNIFNNLCTGFYFVWVKDANGCIYNYDYILLLGSSNANGCNYAGPGSWNEFVCNNNGDIQFNNPITGTPPFQFSLDGVNYQSTCQFFNLGPNLQYLYIKDATGLVTIELIPLVPGCITQLNISEIDASCQSGNGVLTVAVSNGTSPYSYSIDGINYQSSNTFSGLLAGNYTITVKDANGALTSQSSTVNDNCPVVTLTQNAALCGQLNGSITATGTKGTGPYQYSIDGIIFQASNIFSGLASGNYTVTIIDANGSTNTASITVGSNCLQVSVSISNNTCGKNNGSITVTAINGLAPYNYSIDGVNFQSSNLFSNLTTGNYVVSIKDANGFLASTAVTLVDLPGPQISFLTTPADCNNTNGEIIINPTGGTLPLAYSIDSGNRFQQNNTFLGLDSGLYDIVIKDANNCVANETVQLIALPTPHFTLGNDTTLCSGQTLLLNGPTSNNDQYLWQDNSTSSSYLVSSQGNYSLELTNQYGCSATVGINVLFSPIPKFSIGDDTTICQNTSILLKPTPALPGNYLWSTGSNASTITVSQASLYWLQITTNGCSAQEKISVTTKPTPTLNLSSDTTLCDGQNLILNATNTNATYLWQDGSNGPTFTVIAPGAYSVLINENGCDTTFKIKINYISKPIVDLGKDTSICIPNQLKLDAVYPGASYLWQDGSVLPQYTVSTAGIYAVDVYNNCGDTHVSIKVSFDNCACIFSVPNAFTPNHDGVNDIFQPIYQCILDHFEFKIFNRWGQLVFATQNPGTGWDGYFSNQLQPAGSYVWQISYKDVIAGKPMFKYGTVALIR